MCSNVGSCKCSHHRWVRVTLKIMWVERIKVRNFKSKNLILNVPAEIRPEQSRRKFWRNNELRLIYKAISLRAATKRN